MSLKTIYFPSQSPSGLGPVKAIVREADLPFFRINGDFYLTEEDAANRAESTVISVDESEGLNINADKGHGSPGTVEWHQSQLSSLANKGLVMGYVKDVTGIEIDTKGTLKNVKERAVNMIKEFATNGQSQ